MMKKELFGYTRDGREVYKYWLENSRGVKAAVLNFGGILANLIVPDKNGVEGDVVLGYDTFEPYLENGCFFGAIVGPSANRIKGASFVLEGRRYQLDANDGENNLHSHRELGYHKRIWGVEEGENRVVLSLQDTDGSMGFPGNKRVQVTYSLTEDSRLEIHYEASSDKNTIISMTNHTYFNFAGQNKKIYDHILELQASAYTPLEAGATPTGEIRPVEGTPLDFRKARRVGDGIDSDHDQIRLMGGYDQNWVLDNADGTVREFATVTEPTSGRVMKVYTDLPGVQFYTGNFITKQTGKENAEYEARSGLCLETQYFPNSANLDNFPSVVFGPDRKYVSTTIFQFV